MLLAVDIGNTNVVIGLFTGQDLRARWRLTTGRDRMPDEWWVQLVTLSQSEGLRLQAVRAIVIASVVPTLTAAFTELAQRRLGLQPVVINGAQDLGLPLHVDHPLEVGADRICNAVAAIERFGAPVIVVDFGTATTFDVVDSAGAYVGGAIAPGLAVAFEALTQRAARLFTVALEAPPRAIGRNTRESLQSGTVIGYAELVRGLIRRIRDELGREAPVVATGGLADLVAPLVPEFLGIEPDLTLHGLRIAFARLQRQTDGS
ncbi:MAG: type III pantothenate kinase [Thermomicrobium sp.]|nr:type III pantothenate kinase [Thermomicrobium sp.]MDW8058672.1 type III pantothenate kinase [Thermomicrobium sp.]